MLKRAGIDIHRGGLATFHSLRHTFRTRLAAAGVGQEVAMRLCGHSTVAMSARYNHDLTGLRRAADGLG